jgi:tripartite-type tricarboxylate transporter receptor subunit TctC
MASSANSVMSQCLRRVLLTIALVAATVVAWPAFAQSAYPNKPIRVYVGYAAGGAVDLVARAVGQKISTALGQAVLAVMSSGRSPVFPEVPTIAESGFPGFEAAVWYGFLAPIATPRPVIERLYGEIQKALVSAEVRERLAAVGGEVTPGSTADFAMLIKNERARYEKLVREAKIKPD